MIVEYKSSQICGHQPYTTLQDTAAHGLEGRPAINPLEFDSSRDRMNGDLEVPGKQHLAPLPQKCKFCHALTVL